MSRQLNAAVVGLGVGMRHLDSYHAHAGCRVHAVCDLDPAKLDQVRRQHPDVETVQDAQRVLTDPAVDVVSIASFDNHHADQVVQALDNGKHVFVEKPLCLTRAEAQRIRAAQRRRPEQRLCSNLILRCSPRFVDLHQRIAAGELGELYCIEAAYNYGRLHKLTEGWRGAIDHYSVVLGGGIHLIDLLLWLSGDAVVEVFAYGNQLVSRGSQFRFDDLVVAVLRFRSGLIAKVSSNFGCVYPHFHQLSVYGSQATFENQLDAGRLFRTRDRAEFQAIDSYYPVADKGKLLAQFLDALTTGSAPPVTEDEVFATMAVCFAIEESAASGRPVAVEAI